MKKQKDALKARNGHMKGKLLAGYLSEQALADDLNVSIRTVRNWRSRGTGPAVTFISIHPCYRIEAVREWLLSCEKPMPRARGRKPAGERRAQV
jgi:hypothetical protein